MRSQHLQGKDVAIRPAHRSPLPLFKSFIYLIYLKGREASISNPLPHSPDPSAGGGGPSPSQSWKDNPVFPNTSAVIDEFQGVPHPAARIHSGARHPDMRCRHYKRCLTHFAKCSFQCPPSSLTSCQTGCRW